METTHSIPLKIRYDIFLGKKVFHNRLSASISGGILLDFMQRSPFLPYVLGGTSFEVTPSGTYSTSSFFDTKNINQVNSSVSYEARVHLNFKISSFLQIFIGYGYTQGTRILARGNYRIVEPSGTVISGSMYNKGTYRYKILGLRFMLGKEK